MGITGGNRIRKSKSKKSKSITKDSRIAKNLFRLSRDKVKERKRSRSRSRLSSDSKHINKPLKSSGIQYTHRHSKKSKSEININIDTPLSEMQKVAKTLGIPFGGLTKTKLLRKIHKYQNQ